MFIAGLGALLFGLIPGLITYRALRLKARGGVLSEIVAVVGALAGAAIVSLFRSDVLFGLYAIGLTIGFFAYLALDLAFYGKPGISAWRAIVLPPADVSIPVAPPPAATRPAETDDTDITA